ncbi:hypothetical protein ACQQ2N_15120 [Dokdonella sp. MW10]|uniref:hypothetical protein n=1 Tax=Dokdonella sp. MW10 TaxID=2992926 RepID=UPI003F7D4E9F
MIERSKSLHATAAFAVAMLAACSGKPQEAAPQPSASQAAPAPAATVEAIASAPRVRGVVEAREGFFTACGETTRRRITSIGDGVADAVRTLDAKGEAPRFVIAEGRLSGQDGVELDALELAGTDAWTCESRLDGIAYAARGAQGEWSVEATASATTLVAAPGAAPLVVPYVAPRMERTAPPSEGPVAITIERVPCEEPLTGSVYGWKATVVHGGRTLVGCAWHGDLRR